MENKTLNGNDPLGNALVKAVLTALEKIAFEEPELLPGGQEITGEVTTFMLQVVSPYLLVARIIMPKELAGKLTRTIYRDAEKEIADPLLDDTVGEFLNTIIGTMMGELTLGERIFEMGLPQKVRNGQETPAGHLRRYFFRIEEMVFSIEIYGDAFIDS